MVHFLKETMSRPKLRLNVLKVVTVGGRDFSEMFLHIFFAYLSYNISYVWEFMSLSLQRVDNLTLTCYNYIDQKRDMGQLQKSG